MELLSKNLIKQYQKRKVVDDLSINIKQGEIVGLLGPNGAGKTTSFYMLVGLIRPDSGMIYLDDMNITKLPMYKRAQLGIGYLPQESSIFRDLTVEQNILAPMEMNGIDKKKRKEILEQLLNDFSIQHIRKSKGRVLSGGERRRTEIARLLTINPKFVLLDEPFAGVDPISIGEINQLILQLKHKNIGVLITDHNVRETFAIAARSYLIFNGKLLKAGTTEELINDEKVKEYYLGANFELQ